MSPGGEAGRAAGHPGPPSYLQGRWALELSASVSTWEGKVPIPASPARLLAQSWTAAMASEGKSPRGLRARGGAPPRSCEPQAAAGSGCKGGKDEALGVCCALSSALPRRAGGPWAASAARAGLEPSAAGCFSPSPAEMARWKGLSLRCPPRPLTPRRLSFPVQPPPPSEEKAFVALSFTASKTLWGWRAYTRFH